MIRLKARLSCISLKWKPVGLFEFKNLLIIKVILFFLNVDQDNQENLKLWSLFKDLSIKELESVYQSLNIKFDAYEFESQYFLAAKEFVKTLVENGLAQKLYDHEFIESISDWIYFFS